MRLGHGQVEVDLKYLDTVSMYTCEGYQGNSDFWQVKITMLDGRAYHENFDSSTDAADRAVKVRNWWLIFVEDKLDDLMEILSRSDLPDGTKEEMSEIYSRRRKV